MMCICVSCVCMQVRRFLCQHSHYLSRFFFAALDSPPSILDRITRRGAAMQQTSSIGSTSFLPFFLLLHSSQANWHSRVSETTRELIIKVRAATDSRESSECESASSRKNNEGEQRPTSQQSAGVSVLPLPCCCWMMASSWGFTCCVRTQATNITLVYHLSLIYTATRQQRLINTLPLTKQSIINRKI
jgi:hypothetical protein